MPITLKVEAAVRGLGAFRFSYPIRLTLDDGSEVLLHKYYTDFVNLHSALSSTTNATTTLPPLPQKQWNGRDRVRERRRPMFQYFMDWCLIHAKDNARFLEFLNVRSLEITPSVETSITDMADVPESVYLGNLPGSHRRQVFIKFAFFAFFWLLTWRTMSLAPRASMTGGSMVHSLSAPDIPDIDILQLPEFPVGHDASSSSVQVIEIAPEEKVDKVYSVETIMNDDRLVGVVVAMDIVKDEGANAVEHVDTAAVSAESAVDTKVEDDVQPIASRVADTAKAEEVATPPREGNASESQAMETSSNEVVKSSSNAGETTNRFEKDILFEKKPQVEFFFTPVHGLFAFLGLYVAVLAWSAYSPPENESIVSVEIAFHGQKQIASNPSTPLATISPEVALPQPAPLTLSVSDDSEMAKLQHVPQWMTFEEAQVLFSSISAKDESEEESLSLMMALLMRARGQESSSSIKVLTQFWEEASAMSPQEARDKFIQMTSTYSILERPMKPVDDKSLLSLSSPGDKSALRWWDRSLKSTKEGNESNITSFDSTDISSLSMSPSPIRAANANATGDSNNGLEVGKPTVLKFAEHTKADDDVEDDFGGQKPLAAFAAEVTMGAVVGVVGTAVAMSLGRRLRARLF